MLRLLSSVLLLSFLSLTDGRSRGAPCSILSERNLEMAPQHGARPRTSPSPYILIVTREGHDANETLQARTYYKITMDFDPRQNSLAGFVVRAVYDKNPGLLPADAGKWIIPPSSCAREINCGKGTFVTHKRPRRCSVHNFVWLAPGEESIGEYVYFQASGVLDYNTFWTNIRTRSYRIVAGPTTTTTTTTPKPTTPTTTRLTTTPRTTTTRKTRPPTSATFPPTTTLKPITTPPYDDACEPDGPDCLLQLRRDTSRKFCEINGWQDYCPQLCCWKVKGEDRPDFS